MLSRAAAALRAASTGAAAPLRRPSTAFSPFSSASKRARRKPSIVKRPSVMSLNLIPYHTRIANTVHLVGKVEMPVLHDEMAGGELMAVTVLTHEKTDDTPQFWIPVVFQGDLAHIAASHLKQDDLVYVTGQLTGEIPDIEILDFRIKAQVFADSLSFVENNSTKKHIIAAKQEAASDHSGSFVENNSTKKHIIAAKQEAASDRSGNVKNELLWKDLFTNPGCWKANHRSKQNGLPKYPDFCHKFSNEVLWLDSAPSWVLSQLHDLKLNVSNDSYNVTEGDMTAVPTRKKEDSDDVNEGEMTAMLIRKKEDKSKSS